MFKAIKRWWTMPDTDAVNRSLTQAVRVAIAVLLLLVFAAVKACAHECGDTQTSQADREFVFDLAGYEANLVASLKESGDAFRRKHKRKIERLTNTGIDWDYIDQALEQARLETNFKLGIITDEQAGKLFAIYDKKLEDAIASERHTDAQIKYLRDNINILRDIWRQAQKESE